MPSGTRTGRGLAYCTVHWRIRPRPARPDNRRKRVTNSESRAQAGRARLADRTAARLIRDAKLVTVGAACTTSAGPDEVNTAPPEFLISQPGGTCRQSVISPDICLRHYPGPMLRFQH